MTRSYQIVTFIISLFIASSGVNLYSQDKSSTETQKELLDKLNKLESNTGVFISGTLRAWYQHFQITGPVVQNTTGRTSMQYPEIFLDVNIRAIPINNFSAGGELRLYSNMGNFFEALTAQPFNFLARQVYVDLALFDFVEVTVGDYRDSFIPLMLSPKGYFDPFTPEIFKIKQDSELKEFYLDEVGRWPLQGVRAKFGLRMRDIFDEINFKLLTAVLGSDPNKYTTRMLTGAYVNLVRPMLDIKLGYQSDFEFLNAKSNSPQIYNGVAGGSVSFDIAKKNKIGPINKLEIFVEGAYAYYDSDLQKDATSIPDSTSGIALYGGITAGVDLGKLSLSGSGIFRMVGSGYVVPGAQKRIYDYNLTNPGQNYSSPDWSVPNGTQSTGGALIFNNISNKLSSHTFFNRYYFKFTNPAADYGTTNLTHELAEPSGVATRNRTGVSIDLFGSYKLNDKDLLFLKGEFDYLWESFVYPGMNVRIFPSFLKSFIKFGLSGNLNLKNINDLLPVISGYLKFENVSRINDPFDDPTKTIRDDTINFTTFVTAIGATFYINTKFSILIGANYNSFMGRYIIEIFNSNLISVDSGVVETYEYTSNIVLSAGIQYSFSSFAFLTLSYHHLILTDYNIYNPLSAGGDYQVQHLNFYGKFVF